MVEESPVATSAANVWGRWTRLWSLVLVAALVLLVPLAHASPPDPLWIAGIYDALDSDDAILTATALEGSVDDGRCTVIHVPVLVAIELAAAPADPTVTSAGSMTRAPPEVSTVLSPS